MFIVLAACLLGALLTFAFAPYDIFPLAIISLAGLILLTLNASSKTAFWIGFCFGLGFFGVGVYWVYNSIHFIGDVPIFLSILITGGLIGILAVFPAVVTYLSNRYFPEPSTARIVFAFPAIWVLFEWIRSWIFTGFPWLYLGYSQLNSPLKGFAPVLGVYGVSLAVLLTSALLIHAWLKFKQKHYLLVYLNLFIACIIWIVGASLTLITWTKPDAKPIPVALVQGNIPQSIKWSPGFLQLSFDRYIHLTEPLWGKDKLIIWPESAIPVPLQYVQNFINDLDAKANQTNSELIFGIPMQTPQADGFYNAVVTVGKVRKVYLKRYLVPFGEYTPLANWLSYALNFLNIPMSNIIPGNIIQGPLTLDNVKILTSICYEIAYPELIRSYDPTIGLLLTVTNDAWFGKSNAQAQHLQIAAMRALEFQRPLLFVSNDGITAIINSNGQVESAAPPGEAYVLKGIVQPTVGLTPWMHYGTDPILFILLSLLINARRSKIKAASAVTKEVIPQHVQSDN